MLFMLHLLSFNELKMKIFCPLHAILFSPALHMISTISTIPSHGLAWADQVKLLEDFAITRVSVLLVACYVKDQDKISNATY